MTTIKLPVEVENLLDSVLYAGAFSTYPWYTTFRESGLKERSYHVGITPADLDLVTPKDGVEVRAIISEGRLAEVIQKIIDNRLPRHADITRAIREDDIDAELADVIIQYAVLGDIVLG